MKWILMFGLLLIVGLVCASSVQGDEEGMVLKSGGKIGFENEDGDEEIELADSGEENETEEPEPELYEDDTEDGAGGRGIAVQVHAIIQERKGGTLDVPQGQIVRIVAQNREIYVDNETIPLNATLRVRLKVRDKEHVLAFNSTEDEEEIEIEENGTKVKTKENLKITNQEMFAGDNETEVLITPAEIKERARLKNLERILLHVEGKNPYYDVNGTKKGKLLGIFDVELPIQARINAQTGDVEKEQGPWWSFLVATE